MVFGGSDNQFTSFLIDDKTKSYLNLKLDEVHLPNFGRIIFYTDDVDELFAYMENDETISGLGKLNPNHRTQPGESDFFTL